MFPFCRSVPNATARAQTTNAKGRFSQVDVQYVNAVVESTAEL